MSIKNILATNLRSIMRKQNLTQMALKTKSGVAQATIGRILREETAADIDTIESIATALDMQPWHLLCANLDPENPPTKALTSKELYLYEKLREAAALIVEKTR